METSETLHQSKSKDVLPVLFAEIVAVFCVAYKHLSSPLPNSQSRNILFVKGGNNNKQFKRPTQYITTISDI